jgi:hypothetical protein
MMTNHTPKPIIHAGRTMPMSYCSVACGNSDAISAHMTPCTLLAEVLECVVLTCNERLARSPGVHGRVELLKPTR